jgi:hypothetical protein
MCTEYIFRSLFKPNQTTTRVLAWLQPQPFYCKRHRSITEIVTTWLGRQETG